MYCVSDAMSHDPVTVGPNDSLEHARTLMRLGRIRHLPVLDDGRLVGLVSQRDLIGSSRRFVREVMVEKPLTTAASHPLRKAARLMVQNKIGCLPVAAADGRLLGIITEADFVRFAADMAEELDRLEAMVSRADR
jgi:CBS domain-containing protein